MKKLLREPLLHFILIGVVFFLLYALVSPEDTGDQEILIDESDLEEIATKFEAQWNRLPTESELGKLMQEKIRQEVFYQEALKLNLDHNDEMIKRRLSQKMQFLSNDLADLAQPTQEELEAYLEEHLDKYLTPAIYSLEHIYFSTEQREQARRDAEELLKTLEGASAADGTELGDRFGLPKKFEQVNSKELARRMGTEFTNSLIELPLDRWSGPIRSGYGIHLVYLKERVDPARPVFADVETALRNDLTYERQQQMKAAIFRELVSEYKIDYQLDRQDYGSLIDSIEQGIRK